MSFSSWWNGLFHHSTPAPAPAPVAAPVATPVAAPTPPPALAPANDPTVVTSGVYRNRDDFMKAISQSVIATYLDGYLVHNGQGGINFYTQQPSGIISTAPPAPLGMRPTPVPPPPPAPPPPVVVDVGTILGTPGTGPSGTPPPPEAKANGQGNIPVTSLSGPGPWPNQPPYPDQSYLFYTTAWQPQLGDLFFKVLSGSNVDISNAQNLGSIYYPGFNPATYSTPMSSQLIAAVKALGG